MDGKVSETVWKRGFIFFPNYAKAMHYLESPEEQGQFAKAIIDYMYYEQEPKFQEGTLIGIMWDMVEPNLRKSKSQSRRNQGAPKGNQNARKFKEDNGEQRPEGGEEQTTDVEERPEDLPF